jgi:hypothetical protein
MSNNGQNGNSGGTELKVIEGGELPGAAVTMDETDGAMKDVRADAAPADAKGFAADAKDDNVSSAEPLKPEHKKQLHERVEARRQELECALSGLKSSDGTAPQEKVLAIETALQGLDAHLTGGWDRVSEVDAAQLAQWLEGTQYMGVVAAKDEARTPPSDLSPDQALLGATGTVEGSLGPVIGQPTGIVPAPAPRH